jgi:hypothetical protein
VGCGVSHRGKKGSVGVLYISMRSEAKRACGCKEEIKARV